MDTQKHSGLGITSFITSIVSAIFIFFIFVVSSVIEVTTPGRIDKEPAMAAIVGLFLILFIFSSLVALGLGIFSLFQKDRKKIFSILGTIFSAVTIICTALLLIIGFNI